MDSFDTWFESIWGKPAVFFDAIPCCMATVDDVRSAWNAGRNETKQHAAIAAEQAAEIERLRAKLAEANDYINRLRDMLTDSHPCIDPSRDACNCILCELVIRERQQAALAAKEGE